MKQHPTVELYQWLYVNGCTRFYNYCLLLDKLGVKRIRLHIEGA